MSKVYYIKDDGFPPIGEDKLLFIYDNEREEGYRISTGCYNHYFFSSEKQIVLDYIEGVFAWTDIPKYQVKIPT